MRGPGSFIEVTSQSAIDHVLRVNPKKIQRISFANSPERLSPRQRTIAELAKTHHIQLDYGSRQDRMGDGLAAQLSLFVYTELKPFLSAQKAKTKSVILVLDHLQDPQNFGALTRTAEAFGVHAIVIPKDRSVQVTGGVYNASVGAVESIPVVQVSNIAETLKRLKEAEYWIVGSALGENSKPLRATPTFERVAIVLGTELEGVSPHVLETCDWITQIPMIGKIDSLNVSAAGAILMYFFSNR